MTKLSTKTFQDELFRVSKSIDSANNNIEINELLESLVSSLLDTEFCSVWFYNEKERTLLRERGNAQLRTLALDEKKGIIYECFMTKTPQIYNYLASEKGYITSIDNPDNIKIKSKIMYPLLDKDQLVGIVTGYSSIRKPTTFTKSHMKTLEILAPYIIKAISKMHFSEDTQSMCSYLELKEKNTETLNVETTQKSSKVTSPDTSNKMLNEMANFIHDIRTPANTLRGFLELLEEQVEDSRLKEYIVNARESATFINQLTTSMLDRLSLDKEKEESKILEVQSGRFFSGIAEMFISNMYDKNICYNVYIDPFLPKTIEIDELKLKRVILNLIGNAYKFTPSGKTITFSVAYDQKTKTAQIAVKDTGIGIPKEKQEKIFEAYQQADDTTSLEYGGTGLGLSISAEYIAQMGGKLQLESQVDEGSTFYFTIGLKTKGDEFSFTPMPHVQNNITVLMSQKNLFSLMNIVRYLTKMGVNKNNIIAVSSVKEIPKETTHLIVYQSKFDTSLQSNTSNFSKVLVVEEHLYAANSDEIGSNCEVISQYGYYAEQLYKFIAIKHLPKILIADDDKISVSLLGTILKAEHCEISSAQNGKVAMDMIVDGYKQNRPFDIIFIDNHMPLMGGVEVIRNLRVFESDNKLKRSFVISTSGDIFDLGANKDFDKHIGKPFSVADIRNILKQEIK